MSIVALDLEGTLISSAVSQIPRPGLFPFLEYCRRTFARVVVFSAVPEALFRTIAGQLAEDGLVPDWFVGVDHYRPTGNIKDLRAIDGASLNEVLLVDDLQEVCAPGQETNLILIPAFDARTDAEDRELEAVCARIQSRLERKQDL